MFSEDPQLRKIQETCLETLKETARVCDENNLTYYLCGGTLLGAVRHKGFIPWDDDVDVIMPRLDYQKLIHIANNTLNKRYKLEHFSLCNNKKEIRTHHIQIIDTSVDLIRQWTKKEEVIHPWVDIFPFDGMPSNMFHRYLHFYHYRFWHYCMQLSLFEQNVNVIRERPVFQKIVIKFLQLTRFGSNWNTLRILDKMEKISTKYPIDYSDYVCSFHGSYGKREIVPAFFFDERQKIAFENEFFYCSKNYTIDLEHYYGDYMRFDSERTRRHASSIKDERNS